MKQIVNHIAQGKKIFIGLEDSKRTWNLCVRSEGIAIHETSMPAQYEGLRSYLKHRYPECEVTVIYEAGFKGFTLYDKLTADGIKCVVTPPHLVSQEKSNRVKCDKVDARRLAVNLERGDYKCCHVPDRELREDRQTSRLLGQVQRDIVRYKNRIRRFLEVHGSDEGLPAGRWRRGAYENLRELPFSEGLWSCFEVYLEVLGKLQEIKKGLLEKLKVLSRKARYAKTFGLFESAPGVGWMTAVRLVLEWGEDLTRFKGEKSFACFTGLTCSEYSSGEFVRRGRITGQGNRQVRSWLIESAWTAYKRDPALLHKFQAVYDRTSSKKKAIVAVARKLAVRLYALAMSGVPYQLGVVR